MTRSRSMLSGAGRFNIVMGAIFAVPSGCFAIMNLLAGDALGALPWLPFTAIGILFMGWGRTVGRKQRSLAGAETSPVLPGARS